MSFVLCADCGTMRTARDPGCFCGCTEVVPDPQSDDCPACARRRVEIAKIKAETVKIQAEIERLKAWNLRAA